MQETAGLGGYGGPAGGASGGPGGGGGGRMVGMGKRARKANRVSERLRKEVEANQVRVAVVVSPTSDLDLGDVMTLVRPALLYADKVTLHSPKTQLLASMAALPASSDRPASAWRIRTTGAKAAPPNG